MKELVLATLRKNIDQRTSYDEKGMFGIVYLENVYSELSSVMSKHEFSGYLSALRTEKKYQQLDGFFGEVLLEKDSE